MPDAALADLRTRLADTRWPEPATAPGWDQGVPLDYLQAVCRYWADGYEWRRAEARLNAVPQFVEDIDGLPIHYLHVRSPRPGATPIVLTNGWPGSVFEYLGVLATLADDTRRPFDVVVPSLPGYGFSGKPDATGWGIDRIAAAWATLMARLGYSRYLAHGTDWGASVSTSLGQQDAAHVAGIHVSPPIAPPDPATAGDWTAAEHQAATDLAAAQQAGSGYTEQQRSGPQTIGYALTDSPAGLCAWILERYWQWIDHDDDLTSVLSWDALLDVVSTYWFTASAASSARLYWESIEQVSRWFTDTIGGVVDVPTGVAIFPHDVPRPSQRWAARRYRDIRQWSDMPRGGHFPALEVPDLLVGELRAFADLLD